MDRFIASRQKLEGGLPATGPECSPQWEKRVWLWSSFGPSPIAPTPPLLPGDCTEESNQEALIAQAGEAPRPLWLCVNEQCTFQKYLS